MTKDPAFLFYSADFLVGTMGMTDAEVGKYIKLLCLQHQKGKLAEHDMVKVCGSIYPEIFNKFIKDENGLYFNLRLFEEIEKRKAYSNSRRKNRTHVKHMKNICSTHVEHMENENENENRNRNVIILEKDSKKKPFKKPTLQDIQDFILKQGYSVNPESFFNYYESNGWKVGRNAMKDWQATIRTWQAKDGKKSLIQKFGKQAVDSMDAFKAFNESMEREDVKLQAIQSGNDQVK